MVFLDGHWMEDTSVEYLLYYILYYLRYYLLSVDKADQISLGLGFVFQNGLSTGRIKKFILWVLSESSSMLFERFLLLLLGRKQYMLKQVESTAKRSILLLTHLTAAQFCTLDLKNISKNVTAKVEERNIFIFSSVWMQQCSICKFCYKLLFCLDSRFFTRSWELQLRRYLSFWIDF